MQEMGPQFTSGKPQHGDELNDQMDLDFSGEPEKAIDFSVGYTSEQRIALTTTIRQKQSKGTPLNATETAFGRWSEESSGSKEWWNK
jgi:hypothetical protein